MLSETKSRKAGRKLIWVLILILSLGMVGCAQTPTPEKMFSDVSRLVPNVKPAYLDKNMPQILFGHFANCGVGDEDELPVPAGFSGCDLYLFPDKSYIYIKWACASPRLIHDKGNWELRDRFLILLSDQSLPQTYAPRASKYLPLILPINRKEVLLLMSTDWDYPYFLEDVERDPEDPEFTLLICSLYKVEPITINNMEKLRAKLFEEFWDPDWLKQWLGE